MLACCDSLVQERFPPGLDPIGRRIVFESAGLFEPTFPGKFLRYQVVSDPAQKGLDVWHVR